MMTKFSLFPLFLCFFVLFLLDAANSVPMSSEESNEASSDENGKNAANFDAKSSKSDESDSKGKESAESNENNLNGDKSAENVKNVENNSEESKSFENDKNAAESAENEENAKNNATEKVDLLVQKNHIGDIVQLWDEDEMDGNMRNALRSNSNNRWTTLRDSDGKYYIPYIITGTFNSQERQIIQRAMDAIDRNTCIRFKPRGSEADYVDIQNKKDEGCYTTVGRLRGRQVLMLETGWRKSCGTGCTMSFPGCVDHGTVVHELMHKIGLWHEQMRFDRDNYIKILWDNIVPGYRSQFDKINSMRSTTFNLPYDFHSVMQYGKTSGARSRGLVTMETLDKKYQDVIGNAKDASDQDYRKICSIYLCSRCLNRAFTPLRSVVDVQITRTNESANDAQNGDSPSAAECVPLSEECGKSIKEGHSLYNAYCCPKCEECEPKTFCSVIDKERQKSLHETFCCGRCSKN